MGSRERGVDERKDGGAKLMSACKQPKSLNILTIWYIGNEYELVGLAEIVQCEM
jgi:hypothetical protein